MDPFAAGGMSFAFIPFRFELEGVPDVDGLLLPLLFFPATTTPTGIKMISSRTTNPMSNHVPLPNFLLPFGSPKKPPLLPLPSSSSGPLTTLLFSLPSFRRVYFSLRTRPAVTFSRCFTSSSFAFSFFSLFSLSFATAAADFSLAASSFANASELRACDELFDVELLWAIGTAVFFTGLREVVFLTGLRDVLLLFLSLEARGFRPSSPLFGRGLAFEGLPSLRASAMSLQAFGEPWWNVGQKEDFQSECAAVMDTNREYS